jgi:hypothetical protein
MNDSESYFPYSPGDVVRLKKKHPCGSFDWTIVRTGVDYRIKCEVCGRQIVMARGDMEKLVRSIVAKAK